MEPPPPPPSPGRLRLIIRGVNTEPRLLSFAQALRRRLPGDERFGDPLSTAGDKPHHAIAREVAELRPDRPSVAKELGLGALQVLQAVSEASGRGRGEEPVTLLFTDLVEFSSWALEAGDSAALELLRDAGVELEAAVHRHDGTIVKRLGDGLMAAFASPQQAMDAALDAGAALAGVEVAGYRPRMRAGIHQGRPRKLGSDYFGVDVNVAARVAGAAKADQVLISDSAFELVDKEGLSFSKARRLKASGAPADFMVREVSRKP